MSFTISSVVPLATSTAELLEEPALAPPAGVVPHFSTYSIAHTWYVVAAVFCTVVPGLLFLIRLYTRFRLVRKVDLTDYASILGFLGLFSMLAIGKLLFNAGAGAHQWNLRQRDVNNILYWLSVQNIIYCPTIFFIKLVILLQYISLLAPVRSVNPVLYTGSYILIATNLVCYTVSMCVSTWACLPREKIWNDLVPGKCLNNNAMVLTNCLYNIITDIVILLLPASSVWKLKIPRKKKVGTVGLFATGLLACITNVFVIRYLFRMSGSDADATYNMAWLGMWVVAEISLGLCVISLLSIPKFFDAKGKHWLAMIAGFFSTLWTSLATFTMTRHSRDGRSWDDGTAAVGASKVSTVPIGATLSQIQLTTFEGQATPTKGPSSVSSDITDGRHYRRDRYLSLVP